MLPADCVTVWAGGAPYYYSEGIYYEPTPYGYETVVPPVGTVVTTLPPNSAKVIVGDNVYYYANGAFYVEQGANFVVVTPPAAVPVN